ncbi:PAS domain S-box-containing protein [Mucilaginibacter pineti]|uniref:histidine kinase n=1 Tax=Mucilaginibacter pineti TaxID=1391627 RepID=A0A1G6YKB2_9SPHI|nr:PAS domain-containing protein [Mucilaginibacter pineti]SDD90742.1 PAS domain S-box-containing protein [Mucilaginibacter pineti]
MQQGNYKFMANGGEMGALIRAHDWSQTSLGSPNQWPVSLRTTLGIVLNSRFPMFMYWGPDLVCFYNDAYRPSLGINGKHPTLLGKPAKVFWAEIWHILEPLINQVLSGGGATWHEDQLIPFYRNGTIEDIYWTFSYSPVIDENGEPSGILVACTETTQKVLSLNKIKESKEELEFAIDAAELGTWDLNPKTNKFIGNSRLKDWFGLKPADEIELQLAISVIADKDRERVTSAIQAALVPSSGGKYDIEYAIIHPVTQTERIVRARGKTLFDEQGQAIRLNGTLEDISDTVVARMELAHSEQKFRSLILQAPVAIAVFRGPQFIVEVANDPMFVLWGRGRDEIMGNPIFESLPEAQGQGLEALLENVYQTGERFEAFEHLVYLPRNGKAEATYINFVYEPLKDNDVITGVIGVASEVTEQVIARRKIQDAEERTRLAVAAADMGTFDLNMQTGQIIASPRFDAILGIENSPSHADYLEKLHPGDKHTRERSYLTALKTGHFFNTARVIWADGSIHWIQSEGKMYFDEEHKPLRLLGTIIDITGQKDAGEELKRFKFMADNASDVFILIMADGSFAYVNNMALDEWGYDEDEWPDLLVGDIDVFYTEETFTRAFKLAQEQNIPQYETLYRRKNGTVYPVEISMVSLMLSEKPYLFAVARDITERKNSREELLKTNQRLEIALEAGKLGSYELELSSGFMNCTAQCKANYGIGVNAEFNFPDLMAVVAPENREYVRQRVAEAVENHSVYNAEYKVTWPDGSVHWISASGKATYDENNKAIKMVGVTFDVTEQKLLQQQKDEFIGIASHELKTPVTSIKAYTQVLERILKKKGDTQEAAMIGKMDAQLNRLTSLIADLLDVTKINSGRLQFNYTSFDFNLLITEVVEDLQRTTQKHTLIEDMQETGQVYADRERISQVLVNLVTNAIKYSPHTKNIIVHTRLNNNEIVVSVQDFGIGISKEKQQKVFEQFYRVSGAKQHTFPGLGLGLYISSEIIKRESGRIWVDSEEGKGSTFYFALPLQKPGTPEN